MFTDLVKPNSAFCLALVGITPHFQARASLWLAHLPPCSKEGLFTMGVQQMLWLHVNVEFIFLTFYFAMEYSWLTMFWCFSKGLSHIYILVSILPQIPLPSILPHSPEQSCLYCTVGSCWFICFLIFCNCFIKENDNKTVFCRCPTFFVWQE